MRRAALQRVLEAAARPRVLVPYLFALPGGVRRVLGEGLPRLTRCEVHYAELSGNLADMGEMEAAGVRVDRAIGIPGSAILSGRHGLARAMDLGRAAPRLIRIAFRLRRAMRNFEVVYVHGFREVLLAAVARSALLPGRRPALVWHYHDDVRPGRAYLARSLARQCEAVVAVSDHTARSLRRAGIPSAKIVRVYNAVAQTAPPRSAPPSAWEREKPLLVAPAALRAKKGATTAVEALARVPPEYLLWITGDHADAIARSCASELRRLADALGVGSRVSFLGYSRDVRVLMSRAFAVLCPSIWEEPFGLVAVEPMTVGTPVVVSDRGALPEVVDYGNAGLVFTAGDPASLAQQILRLADPGLREALVSNGHHRVRTVFRYERWTDEMQHVFDRCARRHRAEEERDDGIPREGAAVRQQRLPRTP